VPGVTVNFSQTQPALVTFVNTSGVTDANGKAVASFSSGTEVGVTNVVGALAVNSNISNSQSVAVRGSKPSGLGFYFRCDRGNLPVYTTTTQIETMSCTVRLSDRFGNRVGIPTPVFFATEAGSITASATTAAFDPANPATEGTATVTFSTDMGNGSTPADVDPLPAAASQYPQPRGAEPCAGPASGCLAVTAQQVTRNPRDQLVTIIAMAQGEEGFFDSNGNGVLDNNEIFLDQGFPFIDSNDDGVWGPIYANGPSETYFCGSTNASGQCPAYQGPNGQWDANTLLWKPTWVVFTDDPFVTTAPAGQSAPANDFDVTCLTWAANGTSSTFANIYGYDRWFNTPSSGGTWNTPLIAFKSNTSANLSVSGIGFLALLDNWGAMGGLGDAFEYKLLNAAGTGQCAAPSTPTSPTPCIEKLLFYRFRDGFAGQVELSATNGIASSSTCASPDNVGTSVQFNGAHSTVSVGFQAATVAQ
jgi:hypothetical protein